MIWCKPKNAINKTDTPQWLGIKCHHHPKTLWFPNLWDWGNRRRTKALSKWLGLLFSQKRIEIFKTATYKYAFFLSPSAKTSFHRTTAGTHSPNKSDKRKTPSLSGCPIRLDCRPTANQIESFILSNLSCPASLPSSWSHTQTDLSYQIPCLLLSPAPSSASNRPLESGGHQQKSKF